MKLKIYFKLKYFLPITCWSVAQSFWNFAQCTAVTLLCSVQNCKMIRQQKCILWMDKILWDLSLMIIWIEELLWRYLNLVKLILNLRDSLCCNSPQDLNIYCGPLGMLVTCAGPCDKEVLSFTSKNKLSVCLPGRRFSCVGILQTEGLSEWRALE